MKKTLIITVWTITLMGAMFFAYREGYSDGKEHRYDA